MKLLMTKEQEELLRNAMTLTSPRLGYFPYTVPTLADIDKAFGKEVGDKVLHDIANGAEAVTV